MFAALFLKECKQMLKCLTYYIVIICLVLFYLSQLGDTAMYEKPVPGQQYYGYIYSEDETVIMQKTLRVLLREYVDNSYITYPVGFYKEVVQSDNKQDEMRKIIEEVTGKTGEKLDEILENSDYYYFDDPYEQPVDVAPDMTYEHFKKLMKKADKLLGGGSNYSKTSLKSNARVPMTYEDALQEYKEIIGKNHYAGAFARLFCDYMGVVLGILPVFIAVARGLRDKRAQAREVIYSRQGSSFHIVMSRYLAMLVMLLLPVIILSIVPTAENLYYASTAGISVDAFAYLKYIFGWLLPTIMIATAVGVVLTELTDTAIAILVQGLWWFISVMMGAANIRGGYGWNFIPRHNELGNYEVFYDNFGVLVTNRIGYAVVAVLLVYGTVVIYEWKRKGRLILYGKISANRKGQSKV